MNWISGMIFLYLISAFVTIMNVAIPTPTSQYDENRMNTLSDLVRNWQTKINSNTSPDPSRIFGDFILALAMLADITSGQSIASLVSQFTQYPLIAFIVNFVYIFITAMGVIQLLANRIF